MMIRTIPNTNQIHKEFYLLLMDSKRRIIVGFNGREYKVAWYAGTNDAAIRETIKETVGIRPEGHFVLRDEDDVIIAINQYLPNLSRYIVEERNSSAISSDIQKDTSNTTTAFRGELLKFERINAHLANERTWLAWIRTSLSTLSCAFAFLSLSSSGVFKRVVFGLGCLFCVAVMFVYLTGWSRYRRVKLILGLSFNQM